MNNNDNIKVINPNILDNSYYMISLFYRDNVENNDKYEITNLKLQKMMYFVEAYYMVKNKDAVGLYDSNWSAWNYGPVNKELYRYFKKFGSLSIMLTDKEKQIAIDLPTENKKYINSIYDIFAHFSAFDLVTLTHLEGSPWSNLYLLNKEKFNELNDTVIDKIQTRDWFEKRFEFIFTDGEEQE